MGQGLKHQIVPVPGFEGLGMCSVCKAAEGELLHSCPGYALNSEALWACYRGDVVDLCYYRRRRP